MRKCLNSVVIEMPDNPERVSRLQRLDQCTRQGEKAYDDMYEADSPSQAAGFYSDAKESFREAIRLAAELERNTDVEVLRNRLEHIKAVFRSQFS